MIAAARILVPASPERFDGVRDFACQLGGALQSTIRAELVTVCDDAAPPRGAHVLESWRDLDADAADTTAIVVNYMPTAWLRRDTPALLRMLARFRADGGKVIVVIHEYEIDSDGSLRRHVARLAFRRLARAFARRADALVATHGLAVRRLRRDGLDRIARVAVIPIGSSIAGRAGETLLGAGSAATDRVVLFGQPAFMDAAAVRALAGALAGAGRPPMRWMCRDAAELRQWLAASGVPEDRVAILAGLDAGRVSDELASAALAFAPIADGVSTRRSTIAAFLQHGLPIVGIRDVATDDLLATNTAFALTSRDDARGMAERAIEVLSSAPSRADMSTAARRLFDDHVAWPRLAAQYLELIH